MTSGAPANERLRRLADQTRERIESCIMRYMTKNEAIRFLAIRHNMTPVFTKLVWEKLEEENPVFFRAYNRRLTLIDQITMFNELLQIQTEYMLRQQPNYGQLILREHNGEFGSDQMQRLHLRNEGHRHGLSMWSHVHENRVSPQFVGQPILTADGVSSRFIGRQISTATGVSSPIVGQQILAANGVTYLVIGQQVSTANGAQNGRERMQQLQQSNVEHSSGSSVQSHLHENHVSPHFGGRQILTANDASSQFVGHNSVSSPIVGRLILTPYGGVSSPIVGQQILAANGVSYLVIGQQVSTANGAQNEIQQMQRRNVEHSSGSSIQSNLHENHASPHFVGQQILTAHGASSHIVGRQILTPNGVSSPIVGQQVLTPNGESYLVILPQVLTANGAQNGREQRNVERSSGSSIQSHFAGQQVLTASVAQNGRELRQQQQQQRNVQSDSEEMHVWL